VDTNYINGAVTRVRTSTSNWQDTKVVTAAGTAETFSERDTATYVVHGRLSVSFLTDEQLADRRGRHAAEPSFTRASKPTMA